MNEPFAEKTAPIETRAIDESIRHGLDALGRAESVMARIWSDVTGYASPDTNDSMTPSGLVNQADMLAGRIESMAADLNRLHARIAAPNIKSLAPSQDFVRNTGDYAEVAKGQMLGGRASY